MQQCVTWCGRNTLSTTKSEAASAAARSPCLNSKCRLRLPGKLSWISGAPSCAPASGVKTPGRSSYSTTISSSARAAISSVSAATAATSSCSQRTLSLSATLSREKPNLKPAASLPVSTACTPGRLSAAEVSIRTILAWGRPANSTLAASICGNTMSLM